MMSCSNKTCNCAACGDLIGSAAPQYPGTCHLMISSGDTKCKWSSPYKIHYNLEGHQAQYCQSRIMQCTQFSVCFF